VGALAASRSGLSYLLAFRPGTGSRTMRGTGPPAQPFPSCSPGLPFSFGAVFAGPSPVSGLLFRVLPAPSFPQGGRPGLEKLEKFPP